MAGVTLRIVGAGLQSTIQDLGRPAFQHAAIPGSGAMDRLACRAANVLVGNDEHAAVIETTLIGPTITFDSRTLIALAGGDLGATIEGVPIPVWHAVVASAGSTLRFGQTRTGCRTYIAVAGGIDVPLVFGSRSTYLRGGFGGLEGRALRAGDVLRTGEASALSRNIEASLSDGGDRTSIARWSMGATIRPGYSSEATVRVVDGAHAGLLDGASRAAFADARFRVSASSDRMGYRLEGPALALHTPTELLSEAVTFGTIQLPPGGAPIILMADRQTTGGYPRIGEVASIDLPIVAQLKPGDSVRFVSISLDAAQRLYLARDAELAQARAAVGLRFHSGNSGKSA